MARQVAIKALLADLKEVLENPQMNVAAMPREDDLMVWHANLRSREGWLAGLEGCPVHALLLFSDAYPAAGPEIRLFHALPHPNVHPDASGAVHGTAYRVALWDCNPSLDQWCPAYSVAAVLQLLAAFLFDPALLYDTRRISLAAAARAAAALQVPDHPHTGAVPCPRFPTRADVALAPRLRTVEVRRPAVNEGLTQAHPDVQPVRGGLVGPGGWVEVAGRRGRRTHATERAAAAAGTKASRSSAAALPAPAMRTGGFGLLANLEGEGEDDSEAEWEGGEEDRSEASAGEAAPPPAEQVASPVPDGAIRRKPLLDPSILRACHRSLIADVLALQRRRREAGGRAARLAAHSDSIVGSPDHRPSAEEAASAGPAFDALTPDALAQVLLRMEARDVAALGATCRALRGACADGEVWRGLLRRAFPASPLRCALADYRVAYELEANGVVPELACFFSRAGFEAEALGYSYQFTVNPRTGRADYIMVTAPDLVAVEAVRAGLVCRDATGNEVQGAVPAYISAEHFERALPLLPAALAQLCPDEANPGPERWLDVLPTMLNTCAVLLADHGTAASERALNTYCGLHRLLLALCDRYGLWGRAEARVQRFLCGDAGRSKAAAPSLGELLPLLGASRRHDWRAALPAVLGEAVDRQVLWVCKADPSLAARYRVSPERGGVDAVLVGGVFQASRISLRLLMFHAKFLELVGRPAGQSVGQVMYRLDSLYGRPGAGLRARFQGAVREVLACDGLGGALDAMGLAPLSPAAWTARLRHSWRASLARGYHTPRTDFAAVQARGVSRILLRGQRYSAPPGLARLEVDERWHSRGRHGGFVFLDASCLLFGRRRDAPTGAPLELLEAVDYAHRRSHTSGRDGRACVRHSGDRVDGDRGQHTLAVELVGLPAGVAALFLTMSAWAGARLDDVDQPFISVRDPATGVELCGFQLEDVPAAQRRAHSSVVMLAIVRGAAAGQWDIRALGELGGGAAGDYGEIDETIRSRCLPSVLAAPGRRR